MTSHLWKYIYELKFATPEDFFNVEVKKSEKSLQSFDISHTIKKPGFKFRTIEPVSNFDYILCGTDEGYIGRWNIAERKEEPDFFFQSQRSNILSIKQLSENILVSGSNTADFAILELGKERFSRRTFCCHHAKAVTCVQPIDENIFLTVSLDSTIHLVDKRLKYSNTILTTSDYDKPLAPLKDITFRSPECFGGPNPSIIETDDSSLFIDFSSKENSEIYQIIPTPGNKQSYTISNGRSEAKIIDMRYPEQPYSELPGYTSLDLYYSHVPITSICYDDYENYFAMTGKNGDTVVYANEDSSILPDPDPSNLSIRNSLNPYPDDYEDEDGYLDESLIERLQLDASDLYQVYKFCRSTFKEVTPPKGCSILNMQISFSLHSTAYFGDHLLAGSETGSIILYNSEALHTMDILKPSDKPVNCVTTSKGFYGFAASTSDAVYIYEITHPYKINQANKTLEVFEKLKKEQEESEKYTSLDVGIMAHYAMNLFPPTDEDLAEMAATNLEEEFDEEEDEEEEEVIEIIQE